VQFPPGIAILPSYGLYSKRGQSPSWAGGREAGHDRLLGVPDRGTTACLLRIGPHSAFAISTPDSHAQVSDTALGQRRRPPAQANQTPPESTTERSQS